MPRTAQGSVDAFFGAELPRSGDVGLAAAAGELDAVQARPFSIFIAEDLQAAVAVADRMAEAADAAAAEGGTDNEAVEAALEVAAGLRDAHPGGLTDHAAKLFLTHHRAARNVRIPNLMSRMFIARDLADAAAPAFDALPELGGKTTSAEEDKLGWFREDPLANEHHEHWHLVYLRFDGAAFTVRPRHGELFFYMHQQMLARYDAERLAAGLSRVAPFEDYDADVGEGYNPGGLRIGSTTFLARPANARWQPLAGIGNYSPSDHAQRRDRLEQAVQNKKLEVPGGASAALDGEAGSDLLGHANENSGRSISGSSHTSHYGNHHGFGHVFTAALSDPTEMTGVMADPAAAIRDPFFWRWHRHIDDIHFAYQQKLAPHGFASAPKVEFGGGGDGGVTILEAAPLREAAPQFGRTPEELIEAILGDGRFGEDAPIGEITIGTDSQGQPITIRFNDTLETEMRRGVFQLNTPEGPEDEPRFGYPYLWHPSYHFAVRLRSTAAEPQTVTVRLFLCPAFEVDGVADASIDDRRLWIELDKFEAQLGAGEERVLTRADTESTVVRRPVTAIQANPDVVRDRHFDGQGDDHPDAAACECGWPYHLLYPRGNRDGMRFALLTIVTKDDRLARQGQCGSMSFCAVTDEYPDSKPMGFPFDRPLAKPMAQLVAENPSFSMRFITIRER